MIRTAIRRLLQGVLLLMLAVGTSAWAQSTQPDMQTAQARTQANTSAVGTQSAPTQGAQTPPPRPDQYVLGAGDVIRINVFQNPDLSLETRISEQGQITFPLVGQLALGGLSVQAAEQRIAKALRDGKFVLNPQVNVLLMQIRSAQVSILGQVNKPGRYPIDQVGSKVSEMIAAAGGVVPGASDLVTLTGTRNGRPVKLEIDLPQILQSGKTELDPVVQNGDILHVDRAPLIYVYGEVQRPGVSRLERGMTVMQALAQSGGLTQRGTERGLRIHRRDANGAVKIVQPHMNDPVERDDVIYVRESLF
ncbi:polysaccharide export protein EpsE [Piscinibacter sp. XHJ-5]|uniref:polysaccharide export protein EpsE n=1 Tax=Piscinibacter sp. XHJ-5 TaxID=3037797 RepID=UPI002452BA2F|nr:polysaccharide export protein EpsE [Piscinibacter sp. XHJ-5]